MAIKKVKNDILTNTCRYLKIKYLQYRKSILDKRFKDGSQEHIYGFIALLWIVYLIQSSWITRIYILSTKNPIWNYVFLIMKYNV